MLSSVFSISASAAVRTITFQGGYRGNGANRVYGVLKEEFQGLDTYTDANGVTYTINSKTNTVTLKTDATGKFVFPEYFFDMPGYTQARWVTKQMNESGKKYETGDASPTSPNKFYAGYDTTKYEVKFLPGAEGEGSEFVMSDNNYKASITLAGAIFERDGYVQLGWASTENADEVEYGLTADYTVLGNVSFYPVWEKVVVNVLHDISKVTFGSLCVDYAKPAATNVTITNLGNGSITVTLPTSTAFDIVASGSTTIAPNGGTLSVSIQPKAGLAEGKYDENLFFDFGNPEIDFYVNAKFAVNEHLFVKYVYNNDATYTADGTETAECFSGCGTKDTRIAAGSMKIYSPDYNTADGLLEEYLYHKTVKFVAYGSGMDAIESDNLNTRFRPVKWSVAGTNFGGEFAADATDYTVKYDHGDGNFGTYTLTIQYVEEQKGADGEWVATGVEDVKTFEYSIGPSEKDNQEVVRPNMIVSIIFGLFGYLMDLITSGSLF